MENINMYHIPGSDDLFIKELYADKAIKESFERGYDKAINDIMHIVDDADDCANAMYLLGQFIIERKLSK